MKIQFNGASQLVTGSSYLIDVEDQKIIVDFGLFQGKDEEFYNNYPLQFDPNEIDCVLLTHGHLDHCGLLPLLVKKGYRGPIYATTQTKQIAEVILLDSAKIQELNAIKNHSVELYNTLDVLTTLGQFVEVNFNEKITFKNLSFTFLYVGHVLGAASISIQSTNNNLVFSGDIGRLDQSIIKGIDSANNSKYKPTHVIMESLYSTLNHENREVCNLQLLNIIRETIDNDGSVFIPVFALHRAQEMINILKHFFDQGLLDRSIDVYLDSPMAIKITNIYKNNTNSFSQEFKEANEGDDPFAFSNLNLVKKAKKSIKITNKKRSIILAGSGMAEGGRILRHLYSALSNSKNSVIFVGYQAEGTIGRQLCSDIKNVLIDGNEVEVKAKIYQLHGYSAHGDNDDLKFWLQSFDLSKLQKVFLVHAEIERAQGFADQLGAMNVNSYIPKMYESVELLD